MDIRVRRDFKRFFDETPVPFAVLDADFRYVEANRLYTETLLRSRNELIGNFVFDLFPETPEREAQVRAAFAKALAGEHATLPNVHYSIPTPSAPEGDKTEICWEVHCLPIPDETGNIPYFGLHVQDVTEQVRTAEMTRAVEKELQHRVANLFSVTIATARQTARHHSDLKMFLDAFTGRLAALQSTYAMLTGQDWKALSFRQLLTGQLRAFQILIGEQIFLSGQDFPVSAGHAQILSMAIYELLTNAQKYGALKGPGGRLDIEYAPVGATGYHLTWTESGLSGLTEPESTGYGSTILGTLLPSQVGGETEQAFHDDRYVFSLRVDPEQ